MIKIYNSLVVHSDLPYKSIYHKAFGNLKVLFHLLLIRVFHISLHFEELTLLTTIMVSFLKKIAPAIIIENPDNNISILLPLIKLEMITTSPNTNRRVPKIENADDIFPDICCITHAIFVLEESLLQFPAVYNSYEMGVTLGRTCVGITCGAEAGANAPVA